MPKSKNRKTHDQKLVQRQASIQQQQSRWVKTIKQMMADRGVTAK